ncbi:MAG: TCR/Tet family MFS transporter [Pseudomonadales bacterium]|nr:TCR/Tet family MFS transporter [Pseudomonadales bacterium]
MSIRADSPHAVTFLMVTLFMDTLGFGLIIPVLPGLLTDLSGGTVGTAAAWGGGLMFVYATMRFLFSPVIGNLSDRFGRRPILLVSLATLAVDYVIMGFAPTLFWLFIGRLLSGASAATFATANAYVADVTPEAERAGRYGLIGAAWGVGFVVGPALGGALGELGPRVPFFVAAGLAALNMGYGYFVLPETLPEARRRAFELGRANPIGALRAVRRDAVVFARFGGVAIYFLAHDVNPTTWTYYVVHKFAWSPFEVGLALGVVGMSSAVVSGLLVGPVVGRIGEARAIYLGLASCAICYFGHAFAPVAWALFPFIAIGALVGLVMPSLRAVISRRFPAEARGEMEGAIASMISLVAIVSPLILTQTFHYFSSETARIYFPGAPFFLAGVLALGALACIARILARNPELASAGNATASIKES